jgi:hypothetical protein
MLVGTVNPNGTVSFTPISGSADAVGAVEPAIYGNQNVTINVHSTSFSIDSITTPGTKVWSIGVGLRNLLTYPIGANQNAAVPSDIMGIFVLFWSLPVVTAPSACACTVTVSNAMGAANFTAPSQSYFYYGNRLQAVQPMASTDTTTNDPVWQFTGPSAVTGFSFVLLVSAAWPPPFQTQWTVRYNGLTDSLPNGSAEPRWDFTGLSLAGGGSWTTAGAMVTAFPGHDATFVRQDSLGALTDAFFDATLAVGNAHNGVAENYFGFYDPKAYFVGIALDQVGFVSWSSLSAPRLPWVFVGPTYQFPGPDGSAFHSYRLRKYGSDSVVLCVDGARVLAAAAAAIPNATLSTAVEVWGSNRETPGVSLATWTSVSYTIGSAGSGCS